MMLPFIFVAICAICLGTFFAFLRPSQDQRALDRRLASLGSQRVEGAALSSDLEQYLKTRNTGPFGWIEDMIKDLAVSRWLRLLALQANAKTSVGSLLVWCLGCAAVAFFAAVVGTAMLSVGFVAALAGSVLPVIRLRIKRASRLKAFNNALAECIDMMSRSMRAGHSLPAAIGIVAEQATEPARSEFAEVSRQQNFGLPMRDALNQRLGRVPSQDLRVVATGILVQKDTGGNLAEVLDRISAVIRDRVRIQGEIRTHTAQGRLTGYILCALPVVMLILINMINPGYSTPLLHQPTGQKIMCLGAGLLTVGALVIRQIIRGIEI